MTERVALLVGTRKGLFVLDGDADRKTWDVRGPLCDGWPIHDAIVDPAPGSTPIRKPSTEPLKNANLQSFMSCHVGRRLRNPRGTGSIVPPSCGSMLAMTSAIAKMPIWIASSR